MNPDFESLFRTPVAHRIIEKRTKVLEQFAASISSAKLISVACSPSRFATRKRCFVNVEEKIIRSGGRMITGWIFNEYEGRNIEGEAHAIWQDQWGKERIDITPHDHQPKRVLFLPDSRVALKRGYTAEPYLLLSDDHRIAAICAFDSAIQRLREDKFHEFGSEMVFTRDEIEKARDDAGLPDDVAQYLFHGYREADAEARRLYPKG